MDFRSEGLYYGLRPDGPCCYVVSLNKKLAPHSCLFLYSSVDLMLEVICN